MRDNEKVTSNLDLDASNPFASPSRLPYELPDYRAIRVEHYLPAVRAAMAAQRWEIGLISKNQTPPTASNTLEPWEAASRPLNRVLHALFNQIGADGTPAFEDLEATLAPELATHRDALYMDTTIHARFVALEAAASAGNAILADDDKWLLSTILRDFRRAGVELDGTAQARLRDINTQLTSLESTFGRTLLAATNAAAVVVKDVALLDGLPEDAIVAAAEAAKSAGETDTWRIELRLPTHQPATASLTSHDLRERIQQASESRGTTGKHDTRAILLETVRLRAERAQILGYPHHAAYIAEAETAATTSAINDMLARLTPAAVANARREAKDLQAALRHDQGILTDADPNTAKLRASDWAYYAERVRMERYSLDDSAMRPYLELERVLRDGVFNAATTLFGISFNERSDLTAYHPDARIFEVFDSPKPGLDNQGIGLFVADYFTRDTKRGGAWMNNLIDQNHLHGQRPIVVNNLNITKRPAGEPTLLVWDEVITLFHEFGHALHGLLSDVKYPSQSGTSVPRDFVEYPSQVNEMWAWEPSILRSYAVHHVTGEPLPTEWIETLRASRQFNEGFATTEYLAAALLDQAWHQLTPAQVPRSVDEVIDFEVAVLERSGVDFVPVAPRYRSTYFSHIFAGGYSAAYYAYIWSEILDADTVEWYANNGGLSRQAGERFRRELLALGGSQDPLVTFRRFRGRDPEMAYLLARRGLEAGEPTEATG